MDIYYRLDNGLLQLFETTLNVAAKQSIYNNRIVAMATGRGLRGARVQAGRAYVRVGIPASRRPKSRVAILACVTETWKYRH